MVCADDERRARALVSAAGAIGGLPKKTDTKVTTTTLAKGLVDIIHKA